MRKYERTHEMLWTVKRMGIEIQQIESELKEIAEELGSVSAMVISADKVMSSKKKDGVEKMVLRYMEVESLLAKKKLDRFEYRQNLLENLHKVKNCTYESILYKVYFEDKLLSDVADEMCLAVGYVKNMQSKAIARLDGVLFGER